jgi:hypothetical protein
MDMTLKLIDGKFFRNGEEVKAEFGNREQIALLEKMNRLKDEKTVIGKISSTEVTTYQPIVKFICPFCQCENTVDDFDTVEDFAPDCSDVDDCEIDCIKCGAEFETIKDKDLKRNEIKIVTKR